ncbi:class I SAM-dependent methyltransferase [Fodinicola acaciae]|uniref:class I SAM-dependent methyltransferase n=1 Tax=Fodinicola acaciae TaxID=2681555 RepID=UPI0013D0E56E|nr:methyltransferase domain-containing protein [Fodinicola acaciae]
MERYSDVLFAHDADGERARLALMAEALDPHTEQRIRALRPKPGGRFLELGAGLGTVARWLARTYPSAQVVATDVSTAFLSECREPNLLVLRHDLTTDGFRAASFDLIHLRWVLSNLSDGARHLRRIASWLAPGGVLLVEEASDFALASTRHEAYRRTATACLAAARRRFGADGAWTRTFPEPLVAAGLRDCGSDGNWPGFTGGEPWPTFWRVSFQRVLPDALAAGDITEPEATAGLAALADPRVHDLGITTVAAWGRAATAH